MGKVDKKLQKKNALKLKEKDPVLSFSKAASHLTKASEKDNIK